MITFHGPKLYHKVIVIKTVRYWPKKDTEQWNRIDSPVINTHIYGHLTCWKGDASVHLSIDSLLKKWS